MNLAGVPTRVFLDTCLVNFILDFGEQIHDASPPPSGLPDRVVADIDALHDIFIAGQRAMWQLAISPHTYQEVIQTQDPHRRRHLQFWFSAIWEYWRTIIEQHEDLPGLVEAESIRARLLASGRLDVLPDVADRVLVCDAVVYRCDLFCTRDWTTILRHRSSLAGLPLDVVTPTEWWARIRPHAALWA